MRQLIIRTLNLCPTCSENSHLSRIVTANRPMMQRRNSGKFIKWYVQILNNEMIFNGSKKDCRWIQTGYLKIQMFLGFWITM